MKTTFEKNKIYAFNESCNDYALGEAHKSTILLISKQCLVKKGLNIGCAEKCIIIIKVFFKDEYGLN